MHNAHGNCRANAIQISCASHSTFCDTYVKNDTFVAAEKERIGAFVSGIVDTEFGQDTDAAPRIACNVAECAYNNSFHCRAADVNIDTPGDETTRCKTYRPK